MLLRRAAFLSARAGSSHVSTRKCGRLATRPLVSPIVVQRGGRRHFLLQLGLRLVLSIVVWVLIFASKGGFGPELCSLDLLGSASSIFCGSLVIGHGCFFSDMGRAFFLYGPMQLEETRLQVVSSQKTLLTSHLFAGFREGKKSSPPASYIQTTRLNPAITPIQ